MGTGILGFIALCLRNAQIRGSNFIAVVIILALVGEAGALMENGKQLMSSELGTWFVLGTPSVFLAMFTAATWIVAFVLCQPRLWTRHAHGEPFSSPDSGR